MDGELDKHRQGNTQYGAAISEIVSTTKYDENGANPTLITRIRLHNPVVAIQELNKMDGVYDDAAKVNLTLDNRTQSVIYNLINPGTKTLLERLEHGGRQPAPQLNGDISQEPGSISQPQNTQIVK
jgi:hypothetical protein